MSAVDGLVDELVRAARGRALLAPRRAPEARARRVDGRQRQRPGARLRPLRDQALGCRLRRAHARRDGPVRPRRPAVAGVAGSERAPSSDTAAHAYVYRHMPHVGGVVHTHSPYATAWAARHEPIPCVITGMADEFGGEIPVAPFSIIGDESIGRAIVDTLDRPPLAGRAARQPRRVHDRQGRTRRRQGRGHVRGRGPDGAPRPPARHPGPDRADRASTRSSTATRTSTDKYPRGVM